MIRSQCAVLAAATIATTTLAASDVDPAHAFTWADNLGWLNWGTEHGVQHHGDHLSGLIWSEQAGWITTGNGNGPYNNTGGADTGINILPSGYLDGYAWGGNTGWINFGTEPFAGAAGARWDDAAGRLRGYAWSENHGWINLDDDTHFVAIVPPCPGDATGDGAVNFDDLNAILAAWALQSGDPGFNAGADLDNSGQIDFEDLNLVLAQWSTTC